MTEEKKSKIRTFFKEYHIPLLLGVPLIVYLVAAVTILFYPDNNIYNLGQEYSKYIQSFTFALPSIIAVIIIMNVFYLGKFHDYTREYVKQIWIYIEIKNKIENKIRSFKMDYDKELAQEMNDDIDDYNTELKFFKGEPKWLIYYTLLISGILILTTMLFLTGDYSHNKLLFILISLGFAIYEFIIFLINNENTISRHNDELEIILEDNMLLKLYLEEKSK